MPGKPKPQVAYCTLVLLSEEKMLSTEQHPVLYIYRSLATDPSALAVSTSAYPNEAVLELQAQCRFLFQNVAAVI